MHVVARRQPMRNPLQIVVRVDVLCEVVLGVDGVARVSSLFFLSCSHGRTSFYIRVYPATFLSSRIICQSKQSFSSTLGRSVNPTTTK